jgi:tetratricopeptide (TPR) repeat protein
MGLGEAFVAVADDPFAPLYNPAGWALVTGWSASAAYNRYLPQLEDDRLAGSFLSIVAPYGSGFSYQRFQTDLSTEESLRLTAARGVDEGRLQVGLSGEMLRNSYRDDTVLQAVLHGGPKSKKAFGLDAGLLWRMKPKISVGISASNLLRPDVGIVGPRKLDATLRAGSGWQLKAWDVADLLLCAAYRREGEEGEWEAGVEAWEPKHFLALRAGIAGRNISTGFSVRVSRVRFDYAFVTYLGPEDLTALTNHLASLTWSTGEESNARETEKRRLREWSRENAARFAEEAGRLESSGEYGPAVASYGKALAWDPEDPETARSLSSAKKKWVDQTVWKLALDGQKAYTEGRMSKAILYWQQALSYRPGDAKLQAAIEEALQKKVTGAQKNLLDGLKAYFQEDYATAVEEWTRARETYPRNQALKAALEEATRRAEHAEERRTIMVPGEKSEVQRLSYEAIVYQRNGRNDLAAGIWRKVLEKEPDNTEAKESLTRLKSKPQSIRPAAPARTDPRAKKLYENGLADYASGDLAAAIRKWEEALRLAPDDVNIQNSLIRARMESNPDEP